MVCNHVVALKAAFCQPTASGHRFDVMAASINYGQWRSAMQFAAQKPTWILLSALLCPPASRSPRFMPRWMSLPLSFSRSSCIENVSVYGKVLDNPLSAIWPDQPVHKCSCHSLVRPKRPNECVRRVEQGVLFHISSHGLLEKSARFGACN